MSVKAFVFHDAHDCRVEDVPEPKMQGPYDVLLRPLCVGICFADKHSYEGWLNPYFKRDEILGHEGSAVVLETGSEVTTVQPGDRVAILPVVGCGVCITCRAGFGSRCTNGPRWLPMMEAEKFVAPERACYPISEAVSDVAGSAVESVCCGLRAVRHSSIVLADNVVVFGGDDYAMGALRAALMAGAAQVLVADPLPVRRKIAESLGATVLDPTDADFAASVRELMPQGADQVFTCQENYIPASMDYFRQGCELLRLQGTLNIIRTHTDQGFGQFTSGIPLTREITIRNHGVFFGDEPARGGRARGDFQITIDAMTRGTIDGEAHVSSVIDFDDVTEKKDLDAIYASLPEEEAKIVFRISR